MNIEQSVEQHYSVDNLQDTILGAIEKSGKDLKSIGGVDLAPVDEFHIRGREATHELADLVELPPSAKVLDIGSGLGGTARLLATEYGCQVTGVDLTRAYCEVATGLSVHLGLGTKTSFQQGSALDLSVESGSFDVVWTEHVQMNIENKLVFYTEAARALKPGGKLVFHDALERNKKHGPPAVGLHLLLGPTGKEKFMNVLQSLKESRVEVIQAVLTKSA